MKWVRTLVWMILFVFAILFSIQNREEVTLRFGLYPFRETLWLELFSVPLFLVILCSIFFGLLVGGLSDFYRRLQLRRMVRQNQKTIEKLEKEIQSIRSSSIGQADLERERMGAAKE